MEQLKPKFVFFTIAIISSVRSVQFVVAPNFHLCPVPLAFFNDVADDVKVAEGFGAKEPMLPSGLEVLVCEFYQLVGGFFCHFLSGWFSLSLYTKQYLHLRLQLEVVHTVSSPSFCCGLYVGYRLLFLCGR